MAHSVVMLNWLGQKGVGSDKQKVPVNKYSSTSTL